MIPLVCWRRVLDLKLLGCFWDDWVKRSYTSMYKAPWFVSGPWEGDSFLVFVLTSIFFSGGSGKRTSCHRAKCEASCWLCHFSGSTELKAVWLSRFLEGLFLLLLLIN